MTPVIVQINDPKTGVFTGRCSMIEVPDFVQLKSSVDPDPRILLEGEDFVIHGHRFRTLVIHQSEDLARDVIQFSDEEAACLIATCVNMKRYGLNGRHVWEIASAVSDASIDLFRGNRSDVNPHALLTAMKGARS